MKTNFKSIFKKAVFGMAFLAPFLTISCKKEESPDTVPAETPARIRVYYIAADTVEWDYAPDGRNTFMDMEYSAEDSVFAVNTNSATVQRIGSKYKKVRYIEYEDSSFTVRKPVDPAWRHLGILGPVIRANVGDSVIVYFQNNADINASIHVHGLRYDANSEGAVYNNGATSGASVEPGQRYMYKYYANEMSGPGPAQGSSAAWLYHSHVEMSESDMYAGLVGAIIVTKRGMGDSNAIPTDVDREFVTLFFIWNENNSPYLEENQNMYCPGFTNPDPDDFEESNLKHSVNGMLYGNLPGIEMNRGEKARWYVLALGNEVDLHTPHWHGGVVDHNGVHTDVVELLPASMLVADMKADNPGRWGFHCHVVDHNMAGMTALYTVR
jgi:FtsP/CotA-like multicopper oxidase with cupredoxin domain